MVSRVRGPRVHCVAVRELARDVFNFNELCAPRANGRGLSRLFWRLGTADVSGAWPSQVRVILTCTQGLRLFHYPPARVRFLRPSVRTGGTGNRLIAIAIGEHSRIPPRRLPC